MHGKKKLFFKACSILPMGPLMSLNRKYTLFVPIYHAITRERLIHLEHILPYGSKNPEQFADDLDRLVKHLKPISYEELHHCIKNGEPVPPKSFIITFDDGLRQTYELATDILLKKGVPAIFYINTGVIDNTGLLHRYKASILIEHFLQSKSASLEKKAMDILQANGLDAPDIYKGLRMLHYGRRFMLDEIAHAIGYDFNAYVQEHKPFMTTAQLQDLHSKGFVLGSHSHMHPEYWNIELAEKVKQTTEAMQILHDKCGETRRTFSFPFLDSRTHLDFFEELNKTMPFELIFGSQKLKKDIVPNLIHRFDGDNNLTHMSTYLKGLLVAHTINQVLGKTVVYR